MRDHLLAQLSTLILITLSAYLIYSTNIDGSWPKPFIQYWDGCFSSIEARYKPGDPVRLRIVATKQNHLAGDVSWSMVNQQTREVTYFATRQTVLDAGFNDTIVRIGVVPAKIEPGLYSLKGLVSYNVNPFRTITYRLQSDQFTIEGPSDGN